MDSIYEFISEFEYLAVFLLLMLGIVGLPIPDETLLIFCGYLISTGKLSWFPTLLSAILGSLSGITLSYGLGRFVGLPVIVRFGARVHLSAALLSRTQSWYLRSGKYLLCVGYFFPGIRHVSALVAGSACLPYRIFALFAYVGGVIWASLFISLGYVAEEEWRQLSAQLHGYAWVAAGTIVFLGALVLFMVRTRNHSDRDE